MLAVAWRNPFDGASLWQIARKIPRSAVRAWRIAWLTDRRMLVLLVAAQVVQGVASAVLLLATAAAMKPLLGAGDAGFRIRHAAGALVLVSVAAGTARLATEVATYAEKRLTPLLVEYADNRVIDAVCRAEVSAYSVPEFADGIEVAEVGVNRFSSVMPDMRRLVSALIKLVTATAVVTALNPLLLIFLIVAVIPTAVGTLIDARLDHEVFHQSIGDKNMRSMMRWHVVVPRYADEIRANGMTPYLRFWYATVTGRATRRSLAVAPRSLRAGLIVAAATGLFLTAMWGCLAWLAISGRVSLPVAATAIVALRMCLSSLSDAVTNVANVFASSSFIDGWQAFLDKAATLACRRGDQQMSAPQTIQVTDACFTYPNRDTPAVDDVSLTLRRGEVIAVVGENGSGKSTLIRLLTGLLLPGSGTVAWDGVNLTHADPVSVWQQVGLVPQEFGRWPLPLRENVTLGEPREDSDEQVWEALDAVGMSGEAHKLPSELDTLLAQQWFGGVSLSGGQWQRVACARAFYRRPAILVLDEPTAALDARGEHAIFRQLRDTAPDRITVVVTHRLDNTRIADRIIVMADGAIAEHGTFMELISAGGLFAELHALAHER